MSTDDGWWAGFCCRGPRCHGFACLIPFAAQYSAYASSCVGKGVPCVDFALSDWEDLEDGLDVSLLSSMLTDVDL